jgi:hypothetical protein
MSKRNRRPAWMPVRMRKVEVCRIWGNDPIKTCRWKYLPEDVTQSIQETKYVH